VSELTPAEVAHVVTHGQHSNRREGLLEIGEAVLLAIVAIATAWSGYQTGKWDGHQASLYSLSSRYRVEADTANTLSGQQRLYDTNTFAFWLNAKAQGNEADAKLFERRFRPEYRPAFRAWLALDPLNNPKAPPGPIFMPQYRNAQAELAAAKDHEDADIGDQGPANRFVAAHPGDHADDHPASEKQVVEADAERPQPHGWDISRGNTEDSLMHTWARDQEGLPDEDDDMDRRRKQREDPDNYRHGTGSRSAAPRPATVT